MKKYTITLLRLQYRKKRCIAGGGGSTLLFWRKKYFCRMSHEGGMCMHPLDMQKQFGVQTASHCNCRISSWVHAVDGRKFSEYMRGLIRYWYNIEAVTCKSYFSSENLVLNNLKVNWSGVLVKRWKNMSNTWRDGWKLWKIRADRE